MGANPTAVEKYGLTPEAIALQKGHVEAAELLRNWVQEEADNDAASSSGVSVTSSASRRRLHPQRSFDALALKVSQHASNPHLHLHNSSTSSLASSSHTPPPITTTFGRRISTSSHLLESGSHRRPSLPAVLEKAVHPAAVLKHALGISSLRRGSEGQHQARGASNIGTPMSGFWAHSAEEFEQEVDDPALGPVSSKASRRKSEDFDQSSRSASLVRSRSHAPGHDLPSTAPPTRTRFFPTDITGGDPRSARIVRTTSIGSATSASSANNFYRPRQSSQLSRRPSMSPGSVASGQTGKVFVEEEDEEHAEGEESADDSRPRVSRAPTMSRTPSARRLPGAPIASQLRTAVVQRRSSVASSAFSLNTASSSRAGSSLGTSETDPKVPLMDSDDSKLDQEMGGLAMSADDETNNETIKASRRSGSGTITNRDRASSVNSSSSLQPTSSSTQSKVTLAAPVQYPNPPLIDGNSNAELVPFRKAETRSSRSNSAGTDGRFSSSPASSYSGPGTLSTYAPSNSTVATSVAPSSPNPGSQHFARKPLLSPLYEHRGGKSDSGTANSASLAVTTSEQARRNVRRAEQDLLAFDLKSDERSLSQQLAAYGQSLSLERKLKASEAASGSKAYVWETLGKDGKRVVTPVSNGGQEGYHVTSAPIHKSTKHADDLAKVVAPQWRAVPSQDRLMPPPPPGRRSVSPSQSPQSLGNSPSRRSKDSKDSSSLSPTILNSTHSAATTRASSPSSTASSTAVYPGPGGVSYVEVAPHTTTPKRSSKTGTRSERGHSQKGGSVTSSKDQVLIDAAEQARIQSAIPSAQLTAAKPKKGGGFARRLLSSVKGRE
ncbi:hypothetical protein P7C70_g3313, partial [Phenoliferia sp. Uapishka_3]